MPSRVGRYLEKRPNLRAALSNANWLLVDKVFRLLLALFVGSWMARTLGAEEFGELSYVLAYVAFFQVVASLGLEGIALRDMAREPDASEEIYGTTLRLRLLAGVTAWAVAIGGLALVKGPSDPSVLLALLVSAPIVLQAADTVDLWFIAGRGSRLAVVPKLLALLGSNTLRVLLILRGAPLEHFAALASLEATAVAASLLLARRRDRAEQPRSFSAARARRLSAEGLPFLLSGLTVIIYMRIDQIMLREMMGATEVGIFSAAVSISQLTHVVPMTLASAIAPVIARKRLESARAYDDALLSVFRAFGGLALVTSMAISLAAPLLMQLLYGPGFAAAADVLAIHAFSAVFVFQGVAQSLWLTNEQRGMASLMKTAAGAFAAVVANLILIPRYGAVGAAVATLISFAVSAMLANLVISPRILVMQFGVRPSR